jgi:hypothetical protein
VTEHVWLGTKIFLCLWHVKRAWLKQTCIKIKDASTCVSALKVLGNIMYNTNCPNDQKLDAWAKTELARVANEMPITNSFWSYIKSKWLQKIQMWVVGNRNLLYVGHDTNVAIENYHANLKAILYSSKGRFHGRCVD